MTENDKKLRELAEKATQGEWGHDGCGYVGAIRSDQLNGGYFTAECCGPDKQANADYIAEANPAAIIGLLDRLEAAEKYAARYRWLETQAWFISEVDWHLKATTVGATEAIDAAMHQPEQRLEMVDCDGGQHAKANPDWPESAEERIDRIGQNGGDGAHYEVANET